MRPSSSVPILIVGETATLRSRLREMLEQTGFRQVDEAEGAREALGKLQTRGSALVLCHWEMDPIDGIALLDDIRLIRNASPVRFILMTPDGSWGRQTTARIAGADAVLVHPIRIENLKAKVDLVLARGDPQSYLRRA